MSFQSLDLSCWVISHPILRKDPIRGQNMVHNALSWYFRCLVICAWCLVLLVGELAWSERPLLFSFPFLFFYIYYTIIILFLLLGFRLKAYLVIFLVALRFQFSFLIYWFLYFMLNLIIVIGFLYIYIFLESYITRSNTACYITVLPLSSLEWHCIEVAYRIVALNTESY